MKLPVLIFIALTVMGCEGTLESSISQGAQSAPTAVPSMQNSSPTGSSEDGGATGEDTPTTGPPESDPVQEETCPGVACGEELFTTFCATCHGAAAGGTPTWPGSIAGFTDIEPIVTNGRGTMAAVPGLNGNDIDSLQMYLGSLADPDPTGWTGEQTYARRCAGCHGADGEGTPRGYQLRQPIDGYFDSVTRNGIDRREFTATMPAFGTAVVTATQLAEIKTKLRSYPAPTGGQQIYEVYCANCHGIAADGGAHPQGLLWVKNFPSTAFYGDVRNGHHLGEPANVDYMPSYPTSQITDADIDAMVSYIKSSL